MDRRRRSEIKVGLFVLAGIAVTLLVVMLIGGERMLFRRFVEFTVTFQNVEGLKVGAPVRMGGIDVGRVANVGYSRDMADATVHVVLGVLADEAPRVTDDSQVKVVPKGLLGDKMVEILRGKSPTAASPSKTVKGTEGDDLMGRATEIADNVSKASKELSNEDLHRDLRESVGSLNRILTSVSEGQGYPTRLLNDPAEAARISSAIEGIERASTELATTVKAARAIVQRVETGPGFAHDLIFGETGVQALASVGNAANEAAVTLRDVRTGNGLARDLLYGGGTGDDAVKNLNEMTADMRDIVRDVKEGKGTVGALLVDPSAYEDLKTILGNIQRNDILKALVRFTIKNDEKDAVRVEAVDRREKEARR